MTPAPLFVFVVVFVVVFFFALKRKDVSECAIEDPTFLLRPRPVRGGPERGVVVVVVVVVRGGLASMMMMMMATMARRRLRLPLLLSSNQSIIMGGGGDTKRTQKRTHTPFIIDTLNIENPKHKKGKGKRVEEKRRLHTTRDSL